MSFKLHTNDFIALADTPIAPGTLTRLELEDGDAQNPPLSFENDPDTGIFKGGENEINVTLGGKEVMSFGEVEENFINDSGLLTSYYFSDDVTVDGVGSLDLTVGDVVPIASESDQDGFELCNIADFPGVVAQNVDITGSSLSTALSSVTGISASLWIKPDGLGGDLFISTDDPGPIGQPRQRLYISGGNVYFLLSNPANYQVVYTATTLVTNRWYHIAVVSAETEPRVYLNGIDDTVITILTGNRTVSVNTHLFVGSYGPGAGRYNGRMRLLQFSSTLWTPLQVQEIYTKQKAFFLRDQERGNIVANRLAVESPLTIGSTPWPFQQQTYEPKLGDTVNGDDSFTMDAATSFGTITLVGNLVLVSMKVSFLANPGGAGAVYVQNLPYLPDATLSGGFFALPMLCLTQTFTFPANTYDVRASVESSQMYFRFNKNAVGAYVTCADMQATGLFSINGAYHIQ